MTYHGPAHLSRTPGIKHHGTYHGYHAPAYHAFPLSFRRGKAVGPAIKTPERTT